MTFDERIETLKEWIAEARHIAFFTGAGISTGSGIPDFRSEDGLYSQPVTINGIEMEPEFMLSDRCLEQFPKEFFQYLHTKMNYSNAKPNVAHKVIAGLQSGDRKVSVITQNIDGLHEAAGSERVYDVHGSFASASCTECGKLFVGDIVFTGDIPFCPECCGIIRPDITLYGESLPYFAMTLAKDAVKDADLFIIVGSSLTVFPAGYIPGYFKGHRMVVINRDETMYDANSLVFREDINDVFRCLKTDT